MIQYYFSYIVANNQSPKCFNC